MGNAAFQQNTVTEPQAAKELLTFKVDISNPAFIQKAEDMPQNYAIMILDKAAEEAGIKDNMVVDTHAEQKLVGKQLTLHTKRSPGKHLKDSEGKPSYLWVNFIYPESEPAAAFEDKCLQVMRSIQYSITERDPKTGISEPGNHLKIAISYGDIDIKKAN